MLYKLSKTNEMENFCGECHGLFLLKCDEGKTLQELSEKFYDILLMLMTKKNMDDLKKE